MCEKLDLQPCNAIQAANEADDNTDLFSDPTGDVESQDDVDQQSDEESGSEARGSNSPWFLLTFAHVLITTIIDSVHDNTNSEPAEEMVSYTIERATMQADYDDDGNPCIAVYNPGDESRTTVSIAKYPQSEMLGPYHLYKVSRTLS